MATWTCPAGGEPLVSLRGCRGDVTIQRWDEPAAEIVTSGDDERLHQLIEQRDNEILISGAADSLRLRLPQAARVTIANQAGAVAIEGVSAVLLANIAGDAVLRAIDATVEIERVRGNLLIEGAGEVVARAGVAGDARISNAAALELEGVGGDLRISEVPAAQVGAVRGDSVISGTAEYCRLGSISGQLTLRDAGSVSVGAVGGDLVIQGARDLDAGRIGGDAQLADIEGSISLSTVGGNLEAQLRGAGLRVARVGGNARIEGAVRALDVGQVGGDLDLRATYAAAGDYRANVGGAATLWLEDEPSLALQAVVRGDIVGLDAPGHHLSPGPIHVTFGAGGCRMQLVVGGDLIVRGAGGEVAADWSSDWGSFADDMTEFGREMAELGRGIAASISAGFSGWPGGRERQRRRGRHRPPPVPPVPPAPRSSVPPIPPLPFDHMRVERIKEIAREAALSGIERAQEAVERALRESGLGGSQEATAPPATPATGPTVDLSREARREPASDEERLAILRMVQEGRITPEEAELLLAALDS